MASADITPPSRTRRSRLLAAAAAVTAATIALTGCASGPSSSHGEISIQYSWIKNEEFAGEFYAYDKGYYTEAGFSKVNGISGPDTGVAKLLSGTVQIALSDAASVGGAIAEQDSKLKIIAATFQKNPFTILSLKNGGNITTPQDLIGKTIGVQDSNASVFNAILVANGIDASQVTVRPVSFDPAPLIKGEVDGFMAYLTNEALTVQLAGNEITNLPYAENKVPFVAETYTVTDDYLAANKDLLKAFLIAEIKGWTHTFKEPVDTTVALIKKNYDEAAAAGGAESGFGSLDPVKTGLGLEAEHALISTDDTLANGLFTISDDLKAQTVASLAAAGWEVTVDELFDTTIIDEIYAENPDLKKYNS